MPGQEHNVVQDAYYHLIDALSVEPVSRRECKAVPEISARVGSRLAAVLAKLAPGQPAVVSYGPSSCKLSAQVAQVLYRGLELEVAEFLHPRTRADVRFERELTVRGDVQRCLPRQGGYQIRLRLFDAQLGEHARSSPRQSVQISATLRVETSGRLYTVAIVDISRSGLRVRSPKPLPHGVRVEVNCRCAQIRGEVRYSRLLADDEFHIGIEAAAESRVFGQTGALDLSALQGTD
jgi:hypothetical protein